MCSQLHQTHADFGPALIPALARVIPAAGAATGGEGGEALSPLARRLKLRLLTELILVVRLAASTHVLRATHRSYLCAAPPLLRARGSAPESAVGGYGSTSNPLKS